MMEPQESEEAARLQARFSAADISQAAFARQFKVPGGASMVNQHVKGRRPINLAAARAYAEGFRVSLAEISPRLAREVQLATRQPAEIDLTAHPDLLQVRKVKLRLQAGVTGFSVESEEADAEPIFFRADWMQARGLKPEALVAVTVTGSSMEPTLYAGDVVVLNTVEVEPEDGVVFAVNYEGEAVIKRMVRDNGTWWLASDNADQRRYPRKECRGGDCIIVGRIRHRQSEHL
jgi:phage repressor protein C with HTH and peptisase S24 domain